LVGDAKQKIDKITLGRREENNKVEDIDKNLHHAFLDAIITKSKVQSVL
jgi:hypothetical protein